MKITTHFNTKRSGKVQFSAQHTSSGWEMDFTHHKWIANPDGETSEDLGLSQGFNHWMANEVVYLPTDYQHFWQNLWERIHSKEIDGAKANSGLAAFSGWCDQITASYPGDAKMLF